MKVKELNENMFTDFVDAVTDITSKSIHNIKWDGRTISNGAASLSNHPDLKKLDDKSMLHIFKRIAKIDSDNLSNAFGSKGTDSPGYPYKFSFYDLAIINGNGDSLSWLINNVEDLEITDKKLFDNPKWLSGLKKLKDSGWFIKNGMEFILYTMRNDRDENVYIQILGLFFDSLIAENKPWSELDKVIPGILDLSNSAQNILLTPLLNNVYKKFISNDDVSFAKWMIQADMFQHHIDFMLQNMKRGGNISKLVASDEDLVFHIQLNYERLGLDADEWYSIEAKEIFMF